jgi:hypothetical protein
MGQYTARQLQVAAGITPVTHDQWRARYYITRKKMGLGNAQL